MELRKTIMHVQYCFQILTNSCYLDTESAQSSTQNVLINITAEHMRSQQKPNPYLEHTA